MGIFPNFRGKNKKYAKPQPSHFPKILEFSPQKNCPSPGPQQMQQSDTLNVLSFFITFQQKNI